MSNIFYILFFELLTLSQSSIPLYFYALYTSLRSINISTQIPNIIFIISLCIKAYHLTIHYIISHIQVLKHTNLISIKYHTCNICISLQNIKTQHAPTRSISLFKTLYIPQHNITTNHIKSIIQPLRPITAHLTIKYHQILTSIAVIILYSSITKYLHVGTHGGVYILWCRAIASTYPISSNANPCFSSILLYRSMLYHLTLHLLRSK